MTFCFCIEKITVPGNDRERATFTVFSISFFHRPISSQLRIYRSYSVFLVRWEDNKFSLCCSALIHHCNCPRAFCQIISGEISPKVPLSFKCCHPQSLILCVRSRKRDSSIHLHSMIVIDTFDIVDDIDCLYCNMHLVQSASSQLAMKRLVRFPDPLGIIGHSCQSGDLTMERPSDL